MALEPVISTIQSASSRRKSLTQRSADYFGMSTPSEFSAAVSLFVFMVVLKLINITSYRFDSDESQHMHVIWAWARGFVQYRDVFDNHMPLFQIMFAPIFGLIGDQATILYWMRYILLPMYFVGAWCTYRIGELLFSRRAGVWAVILVGLYTLYHFISFEFRTDNLWAPLWLLCITTLISGALTMPRALIGGLLLGFCFSVSMKSILLLLALLGSAPIALFLVGRKQLGLSWAHLARCTAAFLAAVPLAPGTIAVAFGLAGVWRDFRYCTFEHNILPHLNAKNHPAWWIIIFPIVFPFVIYGARLIVRATSEPAVAFRRAFIFLICGFYVLALRSFWNFLIRQDYLPYYPLVFVLISAALLAISPHVAKRDLRVSHYLRRVPLPGFVALAEFLLIIATRPFWIDRAQIETNLLRGVLKLTDPGDYVLDCKGETIFRQRCFRPVTESIMMERLNRGLVADNAAERAVETHTCVAVMKGRMPLRAKKFIWENYIPVGNDLRVAGRFLYPSAEDSSRMDFEVVIPASYKIIARDGPVSGTLDGMPYNGARFLVPGRHTFVQTSSGTQLAVLWAQAVDRNFTPEKFSHPRAKG
jgi:Dolichyl-phosphate-mannose-protein mannosyltransferase